MNDYKFLLKNAFEAIQWFKETIKKLNVPETKEQKENKVVDKETQEDKEKEILDLDGNIDPFEVGKMYLFHYLPKCKDTLSYYDMFPLIIVLGIHRKGFSGINLHYLPVEQRMVLLSNLTQKAVLKDGELERLNIKYANLENVQEFQFFKPCFKQYLSSNVKSAIKLIEPKDWAFAAALPIENFRKKSKVEVWVESLKTQNMTL